MRNMEYFKNKRVIIIGLARSGFACANLLFGLGAQVKASDNQDNAATRAYAAELKSKNIAVELGRHSEEFFSGAQLIVISPGVSNDSLPFAWARERKIPLLSEIEVAWLLCAGTVIAVTGSCGKTTVTTLIAKVIKASGGNAVICGNIGNPFSGEVEKIKPRDFACLEVSSFQLETIDKFKPKISLILNFSRNHLDRYKGMEEYLAAKKRIFMNQDASDYLVLNFQDPVLRGLSGQSRAKPVYFSENASLDPNQAAVTAVASILRVDKEICSEVFRQFKGLEHRMERVAEINNVEFINDSKATTVESAAWAIKSVNKPIILIAGGKDKGVDYRLIREPACQKVKKIILIGQAKEKIRQSLGSAFITEEAGDLAEAVKKAFAGAAAGDCVLLSPMCSSFDMFSSFEERGRVFKQAVGSLMTNAKTQNPK